MKPALMLTDLDGTLLRDDKSLSPANRSALERAAAGGCKVVIATGRLLRAIPQYLLDLPFLRYFILMNGAKIWDRQTGEVLYRCEIPLPTAKRVFDLAGPGDQGIHLPLGEAQRQQLISLLHPDSWARPEQLPAMGMAIIS